MKPGKLKIAVLWHEQQSKLGRLYMILDYAKTWTADGHEVKHLAGPQRFVPADIVIVHVDLSVVPLPYLELAARYPRALNGRVHDIRKSRTSSLLLRREDDWDGPVIVKSDLNFGGVPEQVLGLVPRAAGDRVSTPSDYRVHERLQDVPAEVWNDEHLVVERFLPEREGDDYVVRTMAFFGSQATCNKNVGPDPVVHAISQRSSESVEPDPRVLRHAHELGFDMGKFDYVMRDGEPIVLDTNKTMGRSPKPPSAEQAAIRHQRACGLYAYFEENP